MKTVSIRQAKTHLSRLLKRMGSDGGFIIAKSGKPIAEVILLEQPETAKPQRLGFMLGQIRVPRDFDRIGETEIAALFDSKL